MKKTTILENVLKEIQQDVQDFMKFDPGSSKVAFVGQKSSYEEKPHREHKYDDHRPMLLDIDDRASKEAGELEDILAMEWYIALGSLLKNIDICLNSKPSVDEDVKKALFKAGYMYAVFSREIGDGPESRRDAIYSMRSRKNRKKANRSCDAPKELVTSICQRAVELYRKNSRWSRNKIATTILSGNDDIGRELRERGMSVQVVNYWLTFIPARSKKK